MEALRAPEGIMDMQVPCPGRSGPQLLAEVQAPMGGFNIGVAEIDERHQVGMADRLHSLRRLRRALPALTRFHGEEVLEGDAHTGRFAELGKLEQRFAFASLCSGTIEKLVGAKMPAMLDKRSVCRVRPRPWLDRFGHGRPPGP